MSDGLLENRCVFCGGQIEDDNAQNCSYCLMPLRENKEMQKKVTIQPCQNCGSQVIFDIEQQKFTCESCHAVFSIQSVKKEIAHTIDHIVPFQVSEDFAKKKFYEWLTQGNNVPTDILEKTKNISMEKVYVPYMMGKITYRGSWTTDIGYNRSESYIDYVTKKDKEGHSYVEPVSSTRTVTDWQPASGSIIGSMYSHYMILNESDKLIASFDTEETFENVPSIVTSYDEKYLHGSRQLKIVNSDLEKHNAVIPSLARKAGEAQMLKELPGDKGKNAQLKVFKHEWQLLYFYLPFWRITFDYEEIEHVLVATALDHQAVQISGEKILSEESASFEKGSTIIV